MISFLLTAALAVTAPQDSPRPELMMHPVEDVINVEKEKHLIMEKRLALDLVSMAFSQSTADGIGSTALPLIGSLFEKAVAADAATAPPGPNAAGGSLGLLLTTPKVFAEKPFESADDLLVNVKAFMQPPFDRHSQSLKIERGAGGNRILLAYLLPEQQKWLLQFLFLQRHDSGWGATMEASLYMGDTSALEISGLKKSGAKPLENGTEIQKIRQMFKDAEFELLASPRVLSYPGQRSEVMIQQQLSYISEWEVLTVHPGPTEIVDPTIETLAHGMKLKARALQVGDNRFGVEVDTEYSKIKMPIPSKGIVIKGHNLEISVPELITAQMDSKLILPDGGGVVMRLANELDPGKTIYYLLEFHRVEMDQIGVDSEK